MYTDICKCICIIMINYAFIIFIYVPVLYFSHMTIFYHIISCYCFFMFFHKVPDPGGARTDFGDADAPSCHRN